MMTDSSRDMRAGWAWYAVKVKAHNEARALLNLERQGVRVFLPWEERQRTRGRRTLTVLRPVFPGYLFVELDLSAPGWGVINNTYGVSYLVATPDGRPQALPAGVIAELMDRTDLHGRLRVDDTMLIGSEVRISRGAFADWVATVLKAPEGGRVELLLELMGRPVRVSVDRDNLAPP